MFAPCNHARLLQYDLILVEHIWGYRVVNGHSVGDAADFHLSVLMHLMSTCTSSLVLFVLRASDCRRMLGKLRSHMPRRWSVVRTRAHYTALKTGSDAPVANGEIEMLVVVYPLSPAMNWPSLGREPVYIPRILFEACLRRKKVLHIAAGRLDSTVSIVQAFYNYTDVYGLA